MTCFETLLLGLCLVTPSKPSYVAKFDDSDKRSWENIKQDYQSDEDQKFKGGINGKISHARIIQPPKDVAVLDGDDALFFCGVDGSPTPNVNFFLDGQPGRLSNDIGKIVPVSGGSLLRLFKVSSKQNGLKIECLASNHVGNDRASANLKVYKYTDDVPSGFPKFTLPPKPLSADVGKRVRLECEAEGDPPVAFLWLKNGVPVQNSPGSSPKESAHVVNAIPQQYTGRSSLVLENLDVSDDGQYECLASNSHGAVLSARVHLRVRNTYYTPIILEKQDKVEVRPGKGANLTCTATGNPKPQVRWLTDQERTLTDSSEGKAMLFLTDVTEPRRYICEANNSLGTVQHLVRIEILDVPPPPVDLECFSRGPTYAILRWLPGKPLQDPASRTFVPITSYTLILTELESTSGQPMKRQITDISPWKINNDGSVHLKVIDLKPDRRYAANVYAVSLKFGMSDASNTVTFSTSELPPGGPPQAIHATANTMDSITVNWQPPSEPNGKILGYNLYYSMQLRAQLDRWEVVKTTQSHATLRGLRYGATYFLKVNAFNSAGDGPVSEAFPIIVTPGVPPQPINFRGVSISPTAIQLVWSPPELSHGMNILDYHLRCRSAGGTRPAPFQNAAVTPPLSISIPAKHTGYVVEGLQPDTLYQISLAARTKHGSGVATHVEIRTLSNVPSAPQNLRVIQMRRESASSGQVDAPQSDYIVLELKWNPPADTYGELKGYQVSYRLIGPPELLQEEAASGGGGPHSERTPQTHAVRRNVTDTSYTSTQIDNIQFGRDYQFEVAAYNPIDIGVAAQLNITTPENVPGSFPLHLRVRGLSATAVEVSWAPPSKESRNGRIIGYQVHYYRFGSTQTTSGYQNTTQSRLRIDGLQEQTVYTFRVRAFTSSGPGPWSASNTIRTTAELPNPPPQIQAVRINQRQIKVTWSLPQRTDAQPGTADYRPVPVTGFRIYYSKYDNIGDQEAWDILEVGAVTMATLDGLMPSESYVIRIKSRGTDKRYGNWSSPVIVPADRYGLDQRGNFMGRVQDLRCVGTKSDIYGQASLRIMWMPPPDKRLLKEYQIRVTGIKSFINELNERNRVFIGPRTHIVAVPRDGTDGDVSSVSVARSDFLNSADVPMEHSIDSLEPNGIFDVELRAVYEAMGNRPAAETEAPWEKTSCRTKMHPPVNISAPVPVSYNSDTNEVLMRTFRVSERLGPIRRYFLIVTRLERSRSLTNLEKIDWHAELRRLNANKEAETRVAAEFTQMAFRSPQLEIPVGGRENAKRRRRRSAAVPRKRAKLQPPQADPAVAAAPRSDDAKMPSEVLLYDCSLKKGHQYKALLLACIHPDVQHSIVLPKRTNLGYADTYGISDSVWAATTPETFAEEGQTTEYEDEDSLSSTYCAASPWSVAFQPNKSLLFTDPLGVGGRVSSGGFGIGGNRIGPSFFTVILVTVIVSLGLVALICIAVQCFFRRRPKQQRGAIGGKLTSADGSLKTPLMPPPSHTSLLPGIDPVELQSSDFHNKDYIKNPGITPTASPVPGMLNSSRVNSPVPRSVKSVDNMPLPSQPPISLDHLAVHVTNLKSFDNNGLYKEYEAIDPGSGYTWQNANLDLNKPKNRYANVIAYDHSRVLLRQLPGIPCSDYINANYIDGYQRQNAYIATQGPLPETFADFWRMVWEQNSRIIVMMTRLEERARLKCDQYWPSRGTEHFFITPESPPPGAPKLDYTALSVTILENTEYAYYTVRTFAMQKLLAEESATLPPPTGGTSEGSYEGLRPVSGTRHVKQFQFTAWPDCGAPEQAQPLLFFMRQVNQARVALLQQHASQLEANGGAPGLQQSAASAIAPTSVAATTAAAAAANRLGPVIVHCSAGVGRTGAFIAIDSQLERMKHENSVDIFGTVSRMRTQRNFMVQTEQQYAFLYEVLVEAARVSGSEVTVHGLYNYVMKLRQPAPTALLSQYFGEMGNGGVKVNYGGPPQTAASVTSMDIEFQRVPLNLQISGQCTSASLPENMTKNRTSQVLPYEGNRVVLSQLRDLEGADYINASFVDGYWSRQAYIATQAPLANTVKDFWRMVWEHNSPIIVMLSQLTEAGRQLCYQYWPAEHSERYQNFLVEPMVEYNMPSFVLREFRMTDTHDGQSRTLRQFQFSDWRETSSPSRTAEALIELIAQVHKTQAQFGQDGPITVHCSTGAGRTGVFIALSILLERMRCEGVVDLLLTTRLLRTQRNNMIENVDQYAFCYAALLEYLASFEH